MEWPTRQSGVGASGSLPIDRGEDRRRRQRAKGGYFFVYETPGGVERGRPCASASLEFFLKPIHRIPLPFGQTIFEPNSLGASRLRRKDQGHNLKPHRNASHWFPRDLLNGIFHPYIGYVG